MSLDDARGVIERARTGGVFPSATWETGSSAAPIWSGASGTDARTPFDLASLTKVIATTTVAMELVRTGALGLEEPVSAFFGDWRGLDREDVTVRDLLEHASGLPARLVDAPPAGRREFEHEICATPLEYAPRTQSIYSDLGFILLGFLAADRGGAPLDIQFDRLMVRLKPDATDDDSSSLLVRLRPDAANDDSRGVRLQPDLLAFRLAPAARRLAAPTRPTDEDSRRGRLLIGEVHDNYAAALGGVAGHAGLFGTAAAVGVFARAVLRAARHSGRTTVDATRQTVPSTELEPVGQGDPEPFAPALVREFTAKSTVPGSSRALGWDTMLPTSSCGTHLSPRAFGHVGYTGTSLWIDPVRDRYFVLLANRAHGSGTRDDMRSVRRAFHDELGDL